MHLASSIREHSSSHAQRHALSHVNIEHSVLTLVCADICLHRTLNVYLIMCRDRQHPAAAVGEHSSSHAQRHALSHVNIGHSVLTLVCADIACTLPLSSLENTVLATPFHVSR